MLYYMTFRMKNSICFAIIKEKLVQMSYNYEKYW